MSIFYGSSPDAEDRNALDRRTLKTITRPEGVYTVDRVGNIVNFQPFEQTPGGTSSRAPTWAQQTSAAQSAASLAEQQRQFDETFGYNKARGDQAQQLDQAKFEWQKAVDARDSAAADFWKARTYELQRNQQTMDYTKQLQSMSGPQDYVKYWYASRGMTTPRGAESVPYEQAIPSWAQPVQNDSHAGAFGAAARTQAPTWSAPKPAPAAASVPSWMSGSTAITPKALPAAPAGFQSNGSWSDIGPYRAEFEANAQAPVQMSAAVAAGQNQYTPELIAEIKKNYPGWTGPYSGG